MQYITTDYRLNEIVGKATEILRAERKMKLANASLFVCGLKDREDLLYRVCVSSHLYGKKFLHFLGVDGTVTLGRFRHYQAGRRPCLSFSRKLREDHPEICVKVILMVLHEMKGYIREESVPCAG
jgi:hypothetical protein